MPPLSSVRFIFYLCVYACIYECVVCVSFECGHPQRPEVGVGFPGTRVIVVCDLPDVGVNSLLCPMTVFPCSLPPLAFTQSISTSSSTIIPELQDAGYSINVPFRAAHSAASYALYLDQL